MNASTEHWNCQTSPLLQTPPVDSNQLSLPRPCNSVYHTPSPTRPPNAHFRFDIRLIRYRFGRRPTDDVSWPSLTTLARFRRQLLRLHSSAAVSNAVTLLLYYMLPYERDGCGFSGWSDVEREEEACRIRFDLRVFRRHAYVTSRYTIPRAWPEINK